MVLAELSRPDTEISGAEAEAQTGEIYSLVPTGQWADWDGGFAVHVTCEDEIVVYPERPEAEGDVPIFPDPHQGEMSFPQLETLVRLHVTVGSNPIHVLITSECDPRKSQTFPLVLDLLLQPMVQILYVRAEP